VSSRLVKPTPELQINEQTFVHIQPNTQPKTYCGKSGQTNVARMSACLKEDTVFSLLVMMLETRNLPPLGGQVAEGYLLPISFLTNP
jgi:hypothetical protein